MRRWPATEGERSSPWVGLGTLSTTAFDGGGSQVLGGGRGRAGAAEIDGDVLGSLPSAVQQLRRPRWTWSAHEKERGNRRELLLLMAVTVVEKREGERQRRRGFASAATSNSDELEQQFSVLRRLCCATGGGERCSGCS